MGQGNVRFLEELGRGSYGVVHKAKYEGNLVAAKRLHPTLLESGPIERGALLAKFRRECELLEALNHPNVVRLITVIYEGNKPPILITELCDCDLSSFIKDSKSKPKLLLEEVVTIMLDVANGLNYLHTRIQPTIHRDLCPKNILIVKKDSVITAKITDVGLAKMAKMNTFQSPVPGTQKYMAPETFVFAATNSAIYGPEIDIFSFGMTMLETILGRLPSFMENPLAGEGEFSTHSMLKDDIYAIGESNPLKALVLQCLETDPTLRPTAAELVSALRSPTLITEVTRFDFQTKKKHVCDDYHSWIPVRRRTVRELEELDLDEMVSKLDEHHRNVNIATAAGASTSVVATGLVIGGFVGSFFTFGATVPLMIAGGSVAAAGGLTTFGAKMTEVVLSREQFKKVEDTIAEDKAESEGLRQSLEELDRLITKSVNRIFEDDKEPSNLSGKAIEDVMKHFQKITGMKIMDTEQLHPVKSSARGVGAVIAATSSVITVGTASSRLGSAVFDTLSAASRVTHIAGFVTSIIALPIDAYFLITSIRDIKNHTPSEVADRIRDIRSKMQCPEEHEIPGLIEAYITAKVAEVAKVQLKSPNDTFELVDDLDEFVQQDEVGRINALFDDGELTISDDHFLEK